MKEKIEKILDEIRLSLSAEGGDVELVDVSEDGVVKLRLTGACGSCPMSMYTLKMFIEQKLKESITEVKKVEQVF
ncbi:MAG: NifU family protein [Candidatus Omnitrophica bacterium]|nr:NifU family protein [Candidatus Omnitrophota bacterium]